jgi:hypothetical protein
MKKIILSGFLICCSLLYACSKSPTVSYAETIGHEVLHCFFGQWHNNNPNEHNLVVYPDIDMNNQLTDVTTISLYFLEDEALQAKYKQFAPAALDRNVVSVHGFNVRHLTNRACGIYIAIL